MMPNFTKISMSLAAALLLSGCSTLGSLNPFGGGEGGDKGEFEGERISIMSLNENLEVAGKIAPEQVALPPAYINTDWPQVGGNPSHVVQHTAATGNLKRIWSKDVGKGSARKGRVVAPPVVANGAIYTMDGGNRVSAMNADTGSRLWDYDVKIEQGERTRKGRVGFVERVSNPLSNFRDSGGSDKESVGGGVAFADGKIYVTSGLGVILALDGATGEEVWRRPTRTPMHSAPTVAGGRLFAISDDNELFAVNSNTGEILWTYQGIIESARMLTAPSPAIVDETVIAPFASGELIALRVQNGGVLWQDALSSSGLLTPLASLNDIASGPVVADGFVIASAQSGVTSAFDLRTGQRIWSQPTGALSFPLVAGDYVYLASTEGQVVCMSKLDGSVVWIQQLDNFKNKKKRKKRIAWSGPILTGDRLMVTSSQGKAVLLNPSDGSIINEFKVGGEVFVAPIIANETVYVMTDSAKLIALR